MVKQSRTSKMVIAGAFVTCLLAASSSKATSYTVDTPQGLGWGMHWDEYQWEYKPGTGFARTDFSFGNQTYLPTPFTVFADDGSLGYPVTVEFAFELTASRTAPGMFLPPREDLANFGGFGSVGTQAMFDASVGVGNSPPISKASFSLSEVENQVSDSPAETLITWTVPVEVGTQYSLGVLPEHIEFAVNDPVVTDPAHRAVGLLSGRADAKIVDIKIASVPDGGSTYLLLIIAVCALFGFRRKRQCSV
jgi:hypothetical protein